jgi:hypothetical protein
VLCLHRFMSKLESCKYSGQCTIVSLFSNLEEVFSGHPLHSDVSLQGSLSSQHTNLYLNFRRGDKRQAPIRDLLIVRSAPPDYSLLLS